MPMRHQCLTLRTQGPGPPSRPGDTRRGDDPSGTLKLDANCHRLMCHRVLKRHPMGHEALWEWWGRGRHTQAAVNSAFSSYEDRVEIIRSTQAIGWAPPPPNGTGWLPATSFSLRPPHWVCIPTLNY
jgi:hypothetical protein